MVIASAVAWCVCGVSVCFFFENKNKVLFSEFKSMGLCCVEMLATKTP